MTMGEFYTAFSSRYKHVDLLFARMNHDILGSPRPSRPAAPCRVRSGLARAPTEYGIWFHARGSFRFSLTHVRYPGAPDSSPST